jgi:hypothetical protein
MVALELWTLAKAAGRTPWEALHDPHLAYNATVMRAAQEYKRILLLRASNPAAADALMAME